MNLVVCTSILNYEMPLCEVYPPSVIILLRGGNVRRHPTEFFPKVSVGADFVEDLLHEGVYDKIYSQPLRTMSIHDVTDRISANSEPVAIVHSDADEEVTFSHPKLFMNDFLIRSVGWLLPEEINPLLCDGISSWHVVVELHHTRIEGRRLFGRRQMTVHVGVSQAESQQVRINSYAVLCAQNNDFGHGLVLLPRQKD